MTGARIERVFLGYAGPDDALRAPLARAAHWLANTVGRDLSAVVVALPGARAGRLLERRLVRAAPAKDFVPPRITTVGHLPDVLMPAVPDTASRTERTLGWAAALRDVGAEALRPLLPQPPDADDLDGLLALAGQLRALHADLAAEHPASHGARDAATFAAVGAVVARLSAGRDDGTPRPGAGEAARWTVLADVQRRYHAHLRAAGRRDPHDARRAALADPALRCVLPHAHVVLVGTPELSWLERRALERLPARVTALVFADASDADTFDAFGAVRADAWSTRAVPLDTARWRIVGRPAEQGAEAVALARGGGASGATALHDPRDATIGVPAPDVIPHVLRCAADAGVPARAAAGTPLVRTPPGRLLEAVLEHLRRPRFESFAALLRHPDVERALWRGATRDASATAAHGRLRPASDLDDYATEHLPEGMPTTWRTRLDAVPEDPDGDERDERAARDERARNARLDACAAWWDETLGELGARTRRPLREWVEPVRRVLLAVYAGRRLPRPRVPVAQGAPDDAEDSAEGDDAADAVDVASLVADDGAVAAESHAQRVASYGTAAGLAAWRDVLEEAAATAPRGAGELRLTAQDALALLLRAAATVSVPPPPDEGSLELLGTLELLLDDAPRLVLTGFHEGAFPAISRADPLLPDGLRRALGLPDARVRLAREVYTLFTLLRSRETYLVTGRVTARNDPLLPSRLAFHGDDAAVVERVRHLVHGRRAAPVQRDGSRADVRRELPRAPVLQPVTSLSITSFRTYLRSPYLFYLERVVRAVPRKDDLELSPLHFGWRGR